jgi:hypothetical protein
MQLKHFGEVPAPKSRGREFPIWLRRWDRGKALCDCTLARLALSGALGSEMVKPCIYSS